jgi:hypothetical protein
MAENGAPPKRYDTSMLRDFLDHLLCELRVAQLSLGSAPREAIADLSATQDIYRRKYHTTGLLEQMALDNDVDSAQEFDTANASFDAMFAEIRSVEIKRLEELQGLFNEVLRCCGQDEKPVRTFSAAEMLEETAPSQE